MCLSKVAVLGVPRSPQKTQDSSSVWDISAPQQDVIKWSGLGGAFTDPLCPSVVWSNGPWPAIGCSPTPAPPQQKGGNAHELR